MQSVPKVSPPAAVAAVSRPSQGQVLDKIQAELAETRRREDELRRQRQPRDSGGQHSLDTGDLDTGEGEGEEVGTVLIELATKVHTRWFILTEKPLLRPPPG